MILPIAGTSKVAHLEENAATGAITLSDQEFSELDRAPRGDEVGLQLRQTGSHSMMNCATRSRVSMCPQADIYSLPALDALKPGRL